MWLLHPCRGQCLDPSVVALSKCDRLAAFAYVVALFVLDHRLLPFQVPPECTSAHTKGETGAPLAWATIQFM